MMTPAEIRLKQNPILTSLLLGMGQGTFIAERVFPRLPQTLATVVLGKVGKERLQRYDLRRAPGTNTKRIEISYEGQVYSVNQYSVDVPIPRELLREADESQKLNVRMHLDVSKIAMTTAYDVLSLDYEAEVAGLATNPSNFAAGHVVALGGGTKWSATTGTPVTDIRAAAEVIRRKIGKRPNKLILSADALMAVSTNPEVRGYLPNTNLGPATIDQLKVIFNVKEIEVGDAIVVNPNGESTDVWGNNAILAYVPNMGGGSSDVSLAEPGFGFTNVIEGHPFAEPPRYDGDAKSWIYGATFERRANIAYDDAAFLWMNVK